MTPAVGILLCFVLILPLCAWGAWYFWMPMLQETLTRAEQGEAQAAAT